MTTTNPSPRAFAPDDPYDVAIVGWGPTGLALSSLVGRLGYRVIVIERWPTLYGLPRLTHIDGETARIIQAAGDVDWALRDARTLDGNTHVRFVDHAGDLIQAIDATGRLSGFAAHYSIYQPDIEDALAARISTFANVEVRRGWEVLDLQQWGTDVSLAIAPSDRGRQAGVADDGVRTVHARFVIGCDGASSTVRRLAGIERLDRGFSEHWLNFDVRRRRPLPARFDDAVFFFDPARPRMFMPIARTRQRFEFRVLPEEREAGINLEQAWHLVSQYHGLGPDDLEVERCLIYQFEAQVAERWKDGRVILAGDAAHTMPPDLGQGACSGLRDAANLAWKLDRVLSGTSGVALLESYEAERRPNVEAIIDAALQASAALNESDPDRSAGIVGFFRSLPSMQWPASGPLTTGILSDSDAIAGSASPQGVVRRGDHVARFDDIVGGGWHLCVDARRALVASQIPDLGALGVRIWLIGPSANNGQLQDLEGTYSKWFDTHGILAALVRPDFVAYGGFTSAEALAAHIPVLHEQLHTEQTPTTR
jgi:3-(3-hydroxy-phenyl)propionate hydroxylase